MPAVAPRPARSHPVARALASGLLAAAAWSALAGACHDDPACFEGDFVGCRCAGGEHGYAACDVGADAFGACVCDGSTPGVPDDGAGGGGGGAGEGGAGGGDVDLLPIYSPCERDEECDSGLCFQFNAKGPHCTMPCEDGCPAPSTGCNQKGVCKIP